MDKKRMLLIATTPFIMDGLTKVELDVLEYNASVMDITIASRFGFDTPIGQQLLANENYNCVSLPSKKQLSKYKKAITELVEKGNYDVVYIHGNSSMMYFEAKPAKDGGAKKIVTHCHNTRSNFPLLDKLIKKRFNHLVDVKIACSKYVADFAYDGNRVELILNGPDVKAFAFDEQKRLEIRKQLGYTEEEILFGHIGRFSKQKNHSKLIEIFDIIYTLHPNARLLLIGEGERLDEIKALVEERNLSEVVCFLGTTNNVRDYYHAMDALVMPSLHEGLNLVALEAQANGLPLFMSDNASPETFASINAYPLPLEKSAEEWAEIILRKYTAGRVDNTEALKKAGLDKDIMMKHIQDVLMN